MTRSELEHSMQEISENIGNFLWQKGKAVLDILTDEEIKKFSMGSDGQEHPARIAKIILVSLLAEKWIAQQYGSKHTKNLVYQMTRLRRKRGV